MAYKISRSGQVARARIETNPLAGTFKARLEGRSGQVARARIETFCSLLLHSKYQVALVRWPERGLKPIRHEMSVRFRVSLWSGGQSAD